MMRALARQDARYFILEGRAVVPVDMLTWARSFEDDTQCVIRQDPVNGVMVSTVFLGLDHNFSGEGPPVLFETMVFGGWHAGEMDRYSDYDAALAGHAVLLRRVRRWRFLPAPLQHAVLMLVEKARDARRWLRIDFLSHLGK